MSVFKLLVITLVPSALFKRVSSQNPPRPETIKTETVAEQIPMQQHETLTILLESEMEI